MIRFLDFQETLALACSATGSFYVYSENEAADYLARLEKNRSIRAVMFETTFSLDVWSLAVRYDIVVMFPASLEELYRMILNTPAPSLIYVCREIMRMREAYEVSGYLMESDMRSIPGAIKEAVARGDIRRALELYDEIEKSHEKKRTRSGYSDTYGRSKLMKLYKKGNASVCAAVSGYPSPMLHYLLMESKSVDIVMVPGINQRVLRELKLLFEGYDQVIWVSPADTVCTRMMGDRPVRKIISRDIDDLYRKLLPALPRNLRKELHYPGRPEEWPERFLPDVPEPESRMCPGCIYRSEGIDKAHCEKLGIDVYRSGDASDHGSGNRYGPDHRLMIIGRSDEECIKKQDRTYAVKRFLCDGCGICAKECGCPAISLDSLGCDIDPAICTGCGDCEDVCFRNAIYFYVG